ncbi:hypothetical protein Sviol_68500 [Streptomyces violascens]|uniref:Uncharacterized protein n=1 Tax=Streptomyces violascens TaxID=67381 RepID=A0ABQ3QYU5_9ACTN|nr:hypothetical protein Sviol_68500 [Streptomyces violascens]
MTRGPPSRPGADAPGGRGVGLGGGAGQEHRSDGGEFLGTGLTPFYAYDGVAHDFTAYGSTAYYLIAYGLIAHDAIRCDRIGTHSLNSLSTEGGCRVCGTAGRRAWS